MNQNIRNHDEVVRLEISTDQPTWVDVIVKAQLK